MFLYNNTYIEKLLFKISMFFVLLGALNWLFIGAFDINLVTTIVGHNVVTTIIYIVIGICALTMMFKRDTYLPFLGPMIAPCSILQNREPPGATKEVKLIITPNTKVMYWAAEPANDALKTVVSWKEAYQKYENAGVATSNGEGVVILKVRSPQGYTVPFHGKLNPHIHYRVCGEAGFMETVRTVSIDKSEPEGLENSVSNHAEA
jgi:uncharacterized membrane protein YuzA (DUF378 family)